MLKASVDSVLWHLRTLVAGEKAQGQSDHDLLRQFVSHHDETAFAALLIRHGSMVMGVCLRILRDKHLAEDAFQASFLVLAIKAGALCQRGFVAGWLFGVAIRLARKLKAQTCRSRQPVVRENAPTSRDTPMEASKREEEELLAEELQRLPDKYRLPLLLCYFEGLTHEQAAAQLGWTARKVEGMLYRGRERLRYRLIRRGLTPSAAIVLLTETNLPAAVPSTLAASTVEAALNVVSGQTLTACGVSAAVATLAKEGLIMSPKKMMLILALVFLTGTIAIGAGIWAGTSEGQVRDRERQVPDQVLPQEKPASGGGHQTQAKWEYTTTTNDLNALGAAGWEAFAVTGGQPYIRTSRTDMKGIAQVPVTDYDVKFTPIVYHLKRQSSSAAPRSVPEKFLDDAPIQKGN